MVDQDAGTYSAAKDLAQLISASLERNDPDALIQGSASRPGATTIDGTFDLEAVARDIFDNVSRRYLNGCNDGADKKAE